MISAVVLSKNSQEKILKCLDSLFWCDEIVIVDDFSEDSTLDMIKLKFKPNRKRSFAHAQDDNRVKLYQRYLDNDFAAQRNFGLSKANNDWVLFIDSDETVPEKLRQEILNAIRNKEINGYYLKRKDFFLGKWLKYGETAQVKLLRLAQKEKGKWQGRVHEKWMIEGKTGLLEHPLEHYTHDNISGFLEKINWYTDIVAQYWKEQGRKVSGWEIVFYPLGKFLQNYFLKLGFFDGSQGLIMAIMMSFHSFLVRGKLYLLERKNNQ